VLLSQLKENTDYDNEFLYFWEGYLSQHFIPVSIFYEVEQQIDKMQVLVQRSEWNFSQVVDIIPKAAEFLRNVEKQTNTREPLQIITRNFIHQQGGANVSNVFMHIPENWNVGNNQKLINFIVSFNQDEYGDWQGLRDMWEEQIGQTDRGGEIIPLELGGQTIMPYQWTKGAVREIKQTHLVAIKHHLRKSGLEGLITYEYKGPSFAVFD